ncbi:MAG TPA: cellulose binding domain-containing protein, partial [Polyangia bacterium]|nr:cellulose binding domain-containing protein [Polyangia bacterium]
EDASGAGGATLGSGGSSGAGASGGAGGGMFGAAGSTSGTGGQSGASGAAGAAMPCTTCMVKLQYTCRSSDTGQASFVLDVTNESSVSFPLSSLTLRYWYTIEAGKAQELDCDFSKLGCTNLVTSADSSPTPKFVPVTPMRDEANEYAEIAFKAGAFNLDPFLDTGEIQLRLHNMDYSPITQTDDYSFDADNCGAMAPTAIEWPKITAYLDGVLVWGTEPGPPK